MTVQQRYSQHTGTRTHTHTHANTHTHSNQYRLFARKVTRVKNSHLQFWYSSAQKMQRYKILQPCTSVNVQAKWRAQSCSLSRNSEDTPFQIFSFDACIMFRLVLIFSRRRDTWSAGSITHEWSLELDENHAVSRADASETTARGNRQLHRPVDRSIHVLHKYNTDVCTKNMRDTFSLKYLKRVEEKSYFNTHSKK